MKPTPAQRLRALKAELRGQSFQSWLKRHGLPPAIAEYRFAPPRRWRFDWCWPGFGIALENQGGIFSGGRHTRGAALLKEHEKLNAAAMHGFRVLYATPQTIQAPAMLATLKEVLR
jgi:hypothetical protein